MTFNIIDVLDAHTPSITNEDDLELFARIENLNEVDDYALRTCACGQRVDGFYEYVDHLKEVFLGGSSGT